MLGTRRVLRELAEVHREIADAHREIADAQREARREARREFADLRREEAAQHAETRALIADFAQRGEEERRINREILRRNEIMMRQLFESLDDLRQASRAQTEAIFTLVDRLGNGPAASGSA